MATNCLAPGYVRITYHSNGHEHHMTLPVIPDTVAPDFAFVKRGGGTVSQASAMLALYAVLAPLFLSTDTFDGWEAFTQADCASLPLFQNNGTFGTAPGTGTGTNKKWVQAVMTFKSTLGGRGKFTILESLIGQDLKDALSSETGVTGDLRDYVMASDTWIATRDNGYNAVPLNLVTKINDQLRKKYLNP
jgi:hypothetical protein